MTDREKILAAVAQNQPESSPLPNISFFKGDEAGIVEKYINVLTTIGGQVIQVSGYDDIAAWITEHYSADQRLITALPDLKTAAKLFEPVTTGHELADVDLAVIRGHFGVAENGAIWITEELMGHRSLPFIAQHVAVVFNKSDIVPTMHEAYLRIGETEYGFGTFISGPSKTADIEQSLVLGAHGARSMTVFLLG
ncbi:LutC/YkgG family protein [Mucilaginibacter myungsuensis]|uniref:LUD domain-containing protein n=1 Tax=Mucilaginibacter myungsuensis TaxID=649104 RepID=A0A929KX69_9SPHI|nr:LUD domain-containing protein [Mucilaginibacter myungsuensis]MBE9662832.1 LUD domain-containing protein [Mucilaginibacter myungsuensis]MDN3598252.1 LUD domain-containing protein [Mucilaginibacter myungsuensis]